MNTISSAIVTIKALQPLDFLLHGHLALGPGPACVLLYRYGPISITGFPNRDTVNSYWHSAKIISKFLCNYVKIDCKFIICSRPIYHLGPRNVAAKQESCEVKLSCLKFFLFSISQKLYVKRKKYLFDVLNNSDGTGGLGGFIEIF